MNKMKRIWFYVFLVCLLIVPNYTVASTGATNTDGGMYVVNCESWISLRSAPSADAAVITRIPLGEYVRFVKAGSNGYYYVYYKGNLGYALAEYLS